MQARNAYLDFYNTAFKQESYCTKSWGLASFEAGAQSRQTEIDDLVDMVKTSADSEMNLYDELQRVSKYCDELQKRIGEVMEILEYSEYVDSPLQALEAIKAQMRQLYEEAVGLGFYSHKAQESGND